jgi:hypothetical protein
MENPPIDEEEIALELAANLNKRCGPRLMPTEL